MRPSRSCATPTRPCTGARSAAGRESSCGRGGRHDRRIGITGTVTEIVMPRLSDSMEEGTIIKWLKGDGDAVARGDELVEIETDKATMTYEADADGVLQIVGGEGDTLPVGELIARLNGAGEGSGAGRQAAEGAPAPEPGPKPEPEPEAEPEAPAPAPPPSQGDGGERIKASPIARRMAQDRG